MSGVDEEWVRAAMTDDDMVVEVLVRLHRAPPPPPPLLRRATLPLEWSVRQRRSKSVSVNNSNPKKPAHRGSPTTPLSWSGGATSLSGGSEESSRPALRKLPDAARSKVNIDSEKTNSKRSRKKKTLAELKDEENSLLKEKRDLKKEMAVLRLYLERQRATNGNLKRMKIELQPCLDKQSKPESVAEESISGQLQPEDNIMLPTVPGNDNITLQSSASNACPEEKTDAKFVLPDLNMPFDEPGSDVICGMS